MSRNIEKLLFSQMENVHDGKFVFLNIANMFPSGNCATIAAP